MMVRLANKFDREKIKEFLLEFQNETQHRLSLDKTKWSFEFIDHQLTRLFAGAGFVLIAEDGLLCAVRSPCFWIPNVWILQETMWFAKSKKTNVKLLKKYIEIGKEMKRNCEIQEFYFSNFSDADFSKYGAKKICNDWVA